MSLQNFIAKLGPPVSAAWLNAVDALKFTVFNDAATKSAARTALTTDAPLEVANGGTGVRSYGDLITALNITFGACFAAELNNTPSTGILNLGNVNSHVQQVLSTGSNITSFGASANTSAPIYLVRFAGAWTLVHSSVLLLPGAANITTAAGDYLLAQFLGSGNWRVGLYQRAAVAPVETSTVTEASGTFTPTYIGFSSPPTGDIGWYRVGNRVSFKFPAICFGTSNTTGFQMTGMPVALRPAAARVIPVGGLEDNGTGITTGGMAHVASTGTVTFYKDSATSNWTASGNKGFVVGGSEISYTI